MKRSAFLFVIVAFLTSMTILPGTPAPTAQATALGAQTPQMHQFQLPSPRLRTMDDMLADQATHARPRAPGAQREIPFRPGMDPAAYAAAKAAAAAAPRAAKPAIPEAPRVAQARLVNCDGVDETTASFFGFGFFPPDADGAYGFSPTAATVEFVQTTNVHVTVWDAVKSMGNPCPPLASRLLLNVDLNSFFGYFNAFLFDARVVHDDHARRWIISADAFPESAGVQFEFIAVSISDDARGPYFMYNFNTTDVTFCLNCFWDFPQLGIDSQAIIVTANVFNPNGSFNSSRWIFFNKEFAEGGSGLTGCSAFGGVINLPSWAPPKVLDLNPLTWMAEAQPFTLPAGGTTLQLASLTSTGSICPSFGTFPTVTVPAYAIPPSAPQPGSTQSLDTLDARFQNRSTQIGSTLWQVHTSGLPFAGFAAPRLYRIVLAAPPFAQSTLFFASETSQDFNPSIAVALNPTGNFSITVDWSSTDPPFGVNAQVRVGACSGFFGGICSPGRGVAVFTSSTPLTGNPSAIANVQRWGDYSAAAIDSSGSFVGGINEEINNPDDPTGATWGTRYYIVTNP